MNDNETYAFGMAIVVMMLFALAMFVIFELIPKEEQLRQEEERKDAIARELCVEEHFYQSNFERCERLKVSPPNI
jgi:uncharacterized membrane protein